MTGSDVQWRLHGRDDLDALDDAAAGAGVSPVFQPIVAPPSATTVELEALARWPHLGPHTEVVRRHHGSSRRT